MNNLAQIIHERDEARASVAALREALQELVTLKALKDQHDHGELHLCGHEGRVDMDDYKRRKPLAWDAAKKTLSQPNPGAALLERLRCAEAVVEAARPVSEAPGCAWCGNPAFAYVSRFGGDQRGECCPACIAQFGDDAQVTDTLAMPDMDALHNALADWRKLTETHDEPC